MRTEIETLVREHVRAVKHTPILALTDSLIAEFVKSWNAVAKDGWIDPVQVSTESLGNTGFGRVYHLKFTKGLCIVGVRFNHTSHLAILYAGDATVYEPAKHGSPYMFVRDTFLERLSAIAKKVCQEVW